MCGKKWVKKGKGMVRPGSFVLRLFSFLAGGNLRGGLGDVRFQQNIHHFFRCPLLWSRSPLIGHWRDRGSLVIAVGSGFTHLILLLFWAWS